MAHTISAILELMLPPGRYLQSHSFTEQKTLFPTGQDPFPPETFQVFQGRQSVGMITARQLAHWKMWGVLKKGKENRYFISRRKILSLRKNNPIKRAYIQLRQPKP